MSFELPMEPIMAPKGYADFFMEIKTQIHQWPHHALRSVIRELLALYWGLGQNLWLMRQFFNGYNNKPKLQPLVGEISWAKNLLIMARCKDELEQALVRNLRSFLYEMGDGLALDVDEGDLDEVTP